MTMFFYYFTTSLLIVVAILLIMVILIQKGRGGGLASAFGGVGGHTAFGSKTGDVLTWATAIIFGVFLLLAIFANLAFNGVSAQASRVTPAFVTTPAAPAGKHPVAPGKPGSDLPPAPVTADPGVKNTPPAAPVDSSPHVPQDQSMKAPATKPQ